MGVWIETFHLLILRKLLSVTPYVGVWIETYTIVNNNNNNTLVTPYVGVWIETKH